MTWVATIAFVIGMLVGVLLAKIAGRLPPAGRYR